MPANDEQTTKRGSVWTPKDAGKPRRWPSGAIRFRGKVTWPDGKRQDISVPEKHCYSEERAAEYVAHVQEQIDAGGAAALAALAPKPSRIDTDAADAWVDAWIKAKQARGQTSTGDRRAHYEHHIKPVLAGKHVRDWTPDDMRALVASLDTKIAAGDISAKTARNIWGTATKMASDACKSKVAALRVRTDNPAKDVEGPERGEDKAKQFLYPSEFLRLMACADVPLRWRRAVALAVYLFPRAGELRALRWEDVDLEHGTVHIHAAFERRTRSVKSTKTKTARRFAVEPALLPLLRAMHAETQGKGDVCPLPNRMADRLRGWLQAAGIKRRELLDATPTTKPLGFHDLRATGLTWMAVRGDQPLTIMQRAGHEDFQTTQIYIRTAEAIRVGFGDVFPVLPPALLVAEPGPCLQGLSTSLLSARILERDTGFESTTTRKTREIVRAHEPKRPASRL